MAWKVIDISTFNSVTNYTSAANDIDGVLIRCGYRGYGSSGSLAKDNKLETHYSGFNGKTKIGYYWFTNAISDAEARAEADYVIDTLLAGKNNDMPIFIDSEIADVTNYSGRADNLSKSSRTQYTKTLIERIQARGYKAGVYASESWFVSNLDFNTIYNTGAYIWVAKYSSKAPSTSHYDAWQYTSTGSIAGISGNCDVSHVYTDIAGWSGTSIPVDGVVISQEYATISVGETIQLSAHVTPTNATNQGIIWASHAPGYASVDSTGLVTGVTAVGQVDIWAEAAEAPNTYWGTCHVTVTDEPGPTNPSSILITTGSVSLNTGESTSISAFVKPDDAPQGLVWECSDDSILEISSSGTMCSMYAKFAGTATITAKAAADTSITASCTVTISGEAKPTGINISELSHNAKVGEAFDILASVNPLDSAKQELIWETDSNLISIAVNPVTSEICRVTALGEGTAILTAKSSSLPSVAMNCTIIIAGSIIVNVTGVTLNKSTLDLSVGGSETLYATVTPSNATNKNVTWSSSDTTIATVNSSGKVTAVKGGTCTITATTADGGFTSSCSVTIGVPVTGVTLNKSTLNLDISNTEVLYATITPSDAGNKNVTWTSSNTSVATVNSVGLVNPVGNGSCTITVTTQDGGYTASCSLTVTTKITGIHLNKTVTKIEKGKTETLVATLEPSTATPKPITWSSSNPAIATVNSSGKITTITAGNCDITASVESFTAVCHVQSVVYPTNIIVEPTEITHIINESNIETLTIIYEPSDCTEKALTWTSTNNNIVYFDTENNELKYPGDTGECYITVADVKGHQVQIKFTVYIRQMPPVPPIVESNSEHSITLVTVNGCEYSINDGINWQDSPAFYGLKSNYKYYFVQRYKSHEYQIESKPSDYGIGYTKDIVHVESVELDTHELIYDITNGLKHHKFITTILPQNAEIKDVFYRFNNSSIGYIIGDGDLTINGYGEGIVTVTSLDNGVSDTCIVKSYKKWETPSAPMVVAINKDNVTVACDDITVFSIDNGNTWVYGPIISGLKPKTSYNIICKTLASGYRLESDPSPATLIVTPEEDPDPSGKVLPMSITLSAHQLYFDLNKNTYATLSYKITPINAMDSVIWYSSDNNIIKVNTNGELYATGVGKGLVFVRTIYGGRVDCCECYVYRSTDRPNPPTVELITEHSIKLVDNILYEFSMDCENWQSSSLFDGLTKDSYYTLYQRAKAVGDYQPPSEPSYGMTVKTLTDETPGGESPSGYTWGQQVDVDNIPVYGTPYARKSNFTLTGRYFIFNLIEANHRIRITDIEDYIGINGHSLGWVEIADLKLIIDAIYEGDKVIVDGDINVYADGSGPAIHKNKAEMYVTDILIGQEYMYGVTPKPGMNRQGFATADQVVKYKIIDVNDKDND